MKSCTSKGFVTAVQSAMASECSVCYFLIAPLSSRVSCQPVLCGPLLLCRHIQSAGSNWGLSFAETVIRQAFQRPVSFSIEIMGTLSLQSVSSNCRVWESGAHKWSFTRGPAVLFFWKWNNEMNTLPLQYLLFLVAIWYLIQMYARPRFTIPLQVTTLKP